MFSIKCIWNRKTIVLSHRDVKTFNLKGIKLGAPFISLGWFSDEFLKILSEVK